MWHIFVLLLSLAIYIGVGAVISFCIWYMLILFLKPFKIDRLFDVELPLPMAISLLGIGIWYGYNVRGILENADDGFSKPKTEQVKTKKVEETKVYICTGEKSTKYHSSPDCRGLGRCSGEIEEVSEEEAEGMGRTPCKICY